MNPENGAAVIAARENGRPPRDELVRAQPMGLELRANGGTGGMPTLFGHFAVFNQPTEIDSFWEGNFLERIAPGAFKKTLREQTPKVLFQHGMDPQIGDKVLGAPTVLREDAEGAYYEAPLLDTSYNRDLVPGLEAGLYGASFRFTVMREEWVEDPGSSDTNPKGLPERTIKEARVAEFGPVSFPAYPEATAGVRSLTDEFLMSRATRDPERLRAILKHLDTVERKASRRVSVTVTADAKDVVERVASPQTGDYQNALEGIQSTVEAMEAALAQVGYGDTDEPGDTEDVAAGPFSDEEYTDALETLQSLVEAAEGLLEAVGYDDPDEAEDAAEPDAGRSTESSPSTTTAPPKDRAEQNAHPAGGRRDNTSTRLYGLAPKRRTLYGLPIKEQ